MVVPTTCRPLLSLLLAAAVVCTATASYENPYLSGGCPSSELLVTLPGVTGAFCSPPCSSSDSCPAGPSGATARPECAVTHDSSQDNYCALICSVGANDCPGAASCEPYEGAGVCM